MHRHILLSLLLVCVSCATVPDGGTELRVLSYNIKHGYGMDGEVDINRAAELIRRLEPDLVVLQEIDNVAERSGRQDQMAVLSQLTGLHSEFGEFMPYQGGRYGIGLMSRFPILEARNHVLPEGREPRSALDARVRLPNGEELILCSVHLYATAEERLAQAQTIFALYEDLEIPMIMGGDFNSKRGSPVMDLLESRWANPDKGEDRFTIPSDDPRSEIDFILFRPQCRFDVVMVDVIDEPLVSDHRPVLMVLELHPGQSAE